MLGREAGGPMGRRGLGVRGLTTVGRRAVPALLGGALLAACTGGGPGDLETPSLNPISALTSPSTPAKVALLVPLSSQGAPGVIARNLKQAAELALFERDSRVVELIVKDDKGTPEGAKAAADDALKRGATLILGPLYAKSVAAVAPAARKAGVPVVAFSTDRQVAGNGVYLMSFQPAPEVERVIAFAAKRGKLRYAALIPGDGFGKLVEPVFRNAVTPAGWSEFAQKYAKTYQAAPPRIAGFAHDAVSMAIVLAGDASRKGFSAPALTRASGFAGIDGAYRLRLDGTTDRALAILEVQKFGPTVIEPAPNLSAPSPSTTAASEKGFSLLKAFQ
jgi:hypothetical protein